MKVKGSLYWIYSFTSGCKGKMLVAILLAVIGVLCGMAPYFALAGILSGLIQNTLTAERIFCYVGIAVLGETLKMLFNTVSSLKAHRVAYHILGNIRCKLAEKMMRVPMGIMVDTPCCRKKNVGKPCEGEPHARFDEGRMKISSAYSTQIYLEIF